MAGYIGPQDMKTNVEEILVMLGFRVEAIEQEPEFKLLEDVLSLLDVEDVISCEEAEMLEDADIGGIGEVEVLNELKKHGIEHDDLEVDQDDLQFVETKLSYIESDAWDGINSDLRKLQEKMEKTVQELKDKSYNSTFRNLINECENEWKQINASFELFFQDLQELNVLTKNPKNDENFEFFFDNFKIEVDKFTEYASHCINKYTETPGVNLNMGAENNITGHTACEGGENIFSSSLQSRLASIFYQINLKSAGIEIENLLLASDVTKSLNDEMSSNNYEKYLLSSLSFSEKWAELQIKQNIVLPVFEENKKQRETILSSSNNLLPVLQKQVELQNLVLFVINLWNKDRNVISGLVVECKQHLDQETLNVASRVDCLNEVKREYESFFGSDEYKNCTLIEKLNSLTDKYYPSAENKYLKDIAEEKEKELCCVLNNQRLHLTNSKNNILEIDKYIQKLMQNLHSNSEILSQMQELYIESSKVMQCRKEDFKEVTCQLLEDPLNSRLRLIWVYFLTDQKKLQNLKEEIDIAQLNDGEGTPSSFKRSPSLLFATSTPKNNEG